MKKNEIIATLTDRNIKFNKKANIVTLTALLQSEAVERLPEVEEKHTAESTFAEKFAVEETAPVVEETEIPEVEEHVEERIDPRMQTQQFIDSELAKRAEYIMCKYTPGMKRTTVLNRDNGRGMFYCEVQKKSVTFHSKKDMLPECLEAVAKVVMGNKPNPYAVKCSLDDVARVERVRIERKTVAR